MNNTLKYILVAIIFILPLRIFAQKTEFEQDKIDIIGIWKLEADEKSRWEFNDSGKMNSYYVGRDHIAEYSYRLTDTPPQCEDASLSYDKNIPYLELIRIKYNTQNCFYIHALNDKRLTTVDAVTGHIGIWVRVE